MKTIDHTPTWKGALPLILAALESGTGVGKAMARAELVRMAEAADDYNALITPPGKETPVDSRPKNN